MTKPNRNWLPRSGRTTSNRTGDDAYYKAGWPGAAQFVANDNNTVSARACGLMGVADIPVILPGGPVSGVYEALVAHTDWVTSHPYIVGDMVRDAAGLNATACNISGGTAANPCVLTVDNIQGVETGDSVLVAGISSNMGTDILNGNIYYVKVSGSTFALYSNAHCTTTVDTTGKDVAADGTATQTKFYICISIHTSGTFTTDVGNSLWTETVWTASAANLTTPRAMNLTDAITHCEALDSGGYADWRMAHIKEVYGLIDFETRTLPTEFSNIQNVYYWTSTPSNAGGTVHYIVGGQTAYVTIAANTAVYYCHPVRGGQINA